MHLFFFFTFIHKNPQIYFGKSFNMYIFKNVSHILKLTSHIWSDVFRKKKCRFIKESH